MAVKAPFSFHYVQMTISHINYLINSGKINMNPEYQREVVWKFENKYSLIETLLKGYPMPALNFCEDILPDRPKYECLDGKNRGYSINEYCENKIIVNGSLFKDLSEEKRHEFENLNVSVCVFINLDPDDREEYFRRIQKGIVLNQCEIIWSKQSHPLVKILCKINNSMKEKLEQIWFDCKRYKSLQLLINIAFMIMKQNKGPVLQSNKLTSFIDSLDKNEEYNEIYPLICKVVDILYDVIPDDKCKKIEAAFTLDISRWIIENKYKTPDTEIIQNFSNDFTNLSNKLNVELVIVNKYFNLLTTGSSGSQYSLGKVNSRYNIIKELLN
jgi:hypothetical protein